MRVMIVEDEAILALALIRYLESRGHEVVAHFYAAEDSIRLLRDKNPEIVLMDLSLQGDMDGLEAGRIVLDHGIPLVIVSAHTDQETIDGIKAIGCQFHLVKPINYTQLEQVMKAAVEKK